MDHQHLLYYTLILIWLLPFTFGANKFHLDLLNTCLDGKYHKESPSVESELYSQCYPWKYRSCCTNSTSRSLHESLHHNFNLDHCSSIKKLSENCKKHFIQDLCFYECSPNVGPWLVKVDMKIRKERFYNVPLCESDCLDWFDACKNDFTCNGNWLRGWDWGPGGNMCSKNSTCETFKAVFHNATNFCERVWDYSWKVTSNDKPCMRIWFDPTNGNPNDQVARYYVEGSRINSSSNLLSMNSNHLIVISYIISHSLSL